jgi:DNA-directed RNA polymerase subunit RPC12/RpoP
MLEADLRTKSNLYNDGTTKLQQIHEEVNAIQNYETIAKAYEEKRAYDIADAKQVNGEPCIVLGSGASLDLAMPYLKDWKGGLIVTTSHALTCIKYGIEPTHIVAIDPFCCWDEIKGINWGQTRTKLITHPGVWPDLIKNWPNEIMLYLQNNGRADNMYNSYIKRMYTKREGMREATFTFMARTAFTIFACSPPLQIFAASRLGYSNIFLSGVDFAFTYNKDRFTNYVIDGFDISNKPIWKALEHPYIKNETDVMTNNGIPTQTIHMFYKKNFLSAWRLSMQQIYTTDKGAITEMPYVDFQDVIKKEGRDFPPLSNEEIIYRSEKYLASVGAFVLMSDKGMNFVESDNPITELPDYMKNVMRRYSCSECKIKIEAADKENHTGNECPSCKKGKLIREVEIDVEANMNRIQKLLDEVEADKKANQVKEENNGSNP